MGNDLSTEKQQEYTRWHSYATVLLIALTVLFAGTTIGLPNDIVPVTIISMIAGLAGILLTVLWFSLEDNHKIRGKPALLIFASNAFGFQVSFLFIALLASLLNWQT